MEKTLVGALLHYFGRKEGQSTQEFQQEIKDLDAADRVYFTKLLEGIGYKIIPSAV